MSLLSRGRVNDMTGKTKTVLSIGTKGANGGSDKATKPSNDVSKQESGYVAVPSFLIPDAIINETQALISTLHTAHDKLDTEINAKLDSIGPLRDGYRSYQVENYDPENLRINMRYEGTEDGYAAQKLKEATKIKAKQDKQRAEVEAHNHEIEAKVSLIEKDIGQINNRLRHIKELLDIIEGVHLAGDTVFNTPVELAPLDSNRQILYLSVLLRSKVFKFGGASGEYESSDVRILKALLQRPHIPVALV